jgi:hypothetical protein
VFGRAQPVRERRVEVGRFVLFLALLFATTGAVASAGTTGTVNGFVRDERTGLPLPRMRVLILMEQTGVVELTKTDISGFFSFASVDIGPTRVFVNDPHQGRGEHYVERMTQSFTVWSDQASSVMVRVHRWAHDLDDTGLSPVPVTTVPPYGGYEADSAPWPWR